MLIPHCKELETSFGTKISCPSATVSPSAASRVARLLDELREAHAQVRSAEIDHGVTGPGLTALE